MRAHCASLVAAVRVDIEIVRNKITQIDVNNNRIAQLEKCAGGLKESLAGLRETVAGLIVKSGMWGAIGGLLPVVVAILVWLMTKGA